MINGLPRAGRCSAGGSGAWEFGHYFFPHGEHTPALTRVIATGCSLANADQWDSRLEMLAPKLTATWAACLMAGVAAFALGASRDRNSAPS